ncbi:MAG: hypothetical protein IJ710_09875 [Prevotella sp.]|nr:hypothetical protein [Prevotella sp.]
MQLSALAENAAYLIRLPLVRLSNYYSQLLERRINIRQTLALVNAQVAFFLAVFPMESPIFIRFACLAWLVSALLKCKKEL